jgi:alkanesulfonate monooxygenase SsuD/methylene tetrahydromethanopterin reductase-like flavin-dependent oxidoreductase (luciferase family)
MHVGLVMECDYREGRTQEEAFAEALSIADLAEESGLDGVWLAERHFAAPRRPTDPGGAGIPSISSVPLVTGLRGFDAPEATRHIATYRAALRAAGYAGDGNVYLRLPIYVAETAAQARSEPEESTTRAYRRLSENLAASASELGTTGSEERAERAERLAHVSYDELLRDRLAYGTPDMVVERLAQWRDQLGLAGVIMEPNVGGRMPLERVLNSIRLYAEEVAPRLRPPVART